MCISTIIFDEANYEVVSIKEVQEIISIFSAFEIEIKDL